MPTPETIDAFLRLGVAGILAVAVVAFVVEAVVPGRTYRRVLAERDAAYTALREFIAVVEAATGIKAPRK